MVINVQIDIEPNEIENSDIFNWLWNFLYKKKFSLTRKKKNMIDLKFTVIIKVISIIYSTIKCHHTLNDMINNIIKLPKQR